MMTIKAKDWVATILVAAIAVPYVGYLIRGEMPFVQDPRGMSAIGLVLGVTAYLVMTWGDSLDRVGKTETALAVLALALGVAALAFAEAAAAEALLAVFMTAILVVWAMKLVDHAGLLHWHRPTGAAR